MCPARHCRHNTVRNLSHHNGCTEQRTSILQSTRVVRIEVAHHLCNGLGQPYRHTVIVIIRFDPENIIIGVWNLAR
eukprot:COSAG01_NODE_63703_length_279_cov_0.572222_1_plen_75_part_10